METRGPRITTGNNMERSENRLVIWRQGYKSISPTLKTGESGSRFQDGLTVRKAGYIIMTHSSSLISSICSKYFKTLNQLTKDYQLPTD